MRSTCAGCLYTGPSHALRSRPTRCQRGRRPTEQLAVNISVQMPANRTTAVAEDFRISAPNVNLTVLPDALKKDCVLFYCADAAPLAQKIAASSSKVTLGDISWK